MSTKILVVFILCLIAVCYVHGQTSSMATESPEPSATQIASATPSKGPTETPGQKTTSGAANLAAPVVLIVSAIAFLF